MAEGPLVHHYTKRLKEVLLGRDVWIEFRLRKLKDECKKGPIASQGAPPSGFVSRTPFRLECVTLQGTRLKEAAPPVFGRIGT